MKDILNELATGDALSRERTVQCFTKMMEGKATAVQMSAVLSIMAYRGAAAEELAGAAQVMQAKATPTIVPDGLVVIDTCGTGGDHANTFNISTAAAIVAAGACLGHGVGVAKHGNRSVTSRSGSSQVLEALGVNLNAGGEQHTRALEQAGICFCYAPNHHPAMKYAAPIRAELGFRTIFNLLGPLTNPAGAKRQVIGVYDHALRHKMAKVLGLLGSEHAMVVHGQFTAGGEHDRMLAGLDELSTTGVSQIAELNHGQINSYEIDPVDVGLPLGHPSALQVDCSEASAKIITGILAGDHSPARDIVALNAAAALIVADLAEDLPEGIALAFEAIDSGKARASLEKLIAITNG